MRRCEPLLVSLLAGVLLLSGAPALAQRRSEDKVDYFRKWLQQDVVYIVSAEEHDVFEKLTTEEEKTRFIEQFWRSRDPDPSTAVNEFREEHYRRIAYANEHFKAGKAGWRTDRGMIFIKFGPPDRRQTNPTGGRAYRTKQELIASERENPQQHMTALPYEIWEYRYIKGMGQEISFEFVAKDGSPDYTLALSPDDKDALFFNTGSHLIKGRGRHYGLKMYEGNPLDRVEKLANAQRPLPFQPSRTFVSTQVRFSELPFSISYQVGEERGESVCDLQIGVPHKSLSYNGILDELVARVDLEIFVRDIRKLVVGHRADELETHLKRKDFRAALEERSTYRTRFALPPGRYLVEVWIKDVFGDASSFDQTLVIIPRGE